jgi:hypothetical protein
MGLPARWFRRHRRLQGRVWNDLEGLDLSSSPLLPPHAPPHTPRSAGSTAQQRTARGGSRGAGGAGAPPRPAPAVQPYPAVVYDALSRLARLRGE